MATARIDRSDDTAAVLKILAAVSGTEDAVTKIWQGCYLADATDPVNNKLAIDSSGRLTINAPNVTNAGTFAVQATVAAAATNIAKAEDAASANADVGVPAMAIQLATPADTAGTDGDYAMLQMSAGRLWASAKIDTALPAGANAIGKLASNSGVTIGAVEIAATQTLATVTTVSTVTIVSALGNSTTGPQKAEDVASANADVGIPAMAVQKASPANTAGTDGDYEFLQISGGRLWASATIDAALPAGGNAIGKLAANSGVIIGDVNIVSNIPGVGATSLGKAEDAVHADGDTGVMMLTVRKNTAAATSGSDGDYQPPVSNTRGATWVAIEDGSGGQITSFGGGTQYAEDSAHASGDTLTLAGVVQQTADAALSGDGDRSLLQVDSSGFLKVNVKAGSGTGGTSAADKSSFTLASGLGTPAMGVVDEKSPVSYGEETVGVLRMSPNRNLYGTLRDASGNEWGANVDSTLGLVVSPGSLMLETENKILRELRSIRLAIVSMVTEAGSSKPEDFDPALIDQFDPVDISIAI